MGELTVLVEIILLSILGSLTLEILYKSIDKDLPKITIK